MGLNADMMDALVTLSADNCHNSPPILTVISFTRLGLLVPGFGKEPFLSNLGEKREKKYGFVSPV
jgi:hypothetical protein